MCQTIERDDAMCFQLDYRGVGSERAVATLTIEGSYIGCTKCSGSLGFRNETTSAACCRDESGGTRLLWTFSEGETPSSGMTI